MKNNQCDLCGAEIYCVYDDRQRCAMCSAAVDSDMSAWQASEIKHHVIHMVTGLNTYYEAVRHFHGGYREMVFVAAMDHIGENTFAENFARDVDEMREALKSINAISRDYRRDPMLCHDITESAKEYGIPGVPVIKHDGRIYTSSTQKNMHALKRLLETLDAIIKIADMRIKIREDDEAMRRAEARLAARQRKQKEKEQAAAIEMRAAARIAAKRKAV